MLRHFAQPFDAGIFHPGVGVQPLGDGVRNHRLPLFRQQLHQPLLLGNQRIDLPRLAVEEGGDGLLLG